MWCKGISGKSRLTQWPGPATGKAGVRVLAVLYWFTVGVVVVLPAAVAGFAPSVTNCHKEQYSATLQSNRDTDFLI